MSYLLSSRHVFVRSGSFQVFVRLPGGWSDDARYLSDAQHTAEGWVYVRPLPHPVPGTPDSEHRPPMTRTGTFLIPAITAQARVLAHCPDVAMAAGRTRAIAFSHDHEVHP